MVGSMVMFGEVVGAVQLAFTPEDGELVLFDAVTDPIKSHVDGFGAFLFDGVVGDSSCGGVVGDNWRWWLWVA